MSLRRAVDISIRAPVGRSHVPYLREQLQKVLATHPNVLAEVSVAIIDDAAMAELHGRFMDDPTSTDVMTFPLEHDASGRCTGGEIVVCLDVARRSAKERGHRIRDELLLYLVHGFLHLTGLDDRTKADYHKMHATEDRILKRIGIGAVFAPPVGAKRSPKGST